MNFDSDISQCIAEILNSEVISPSDNNRKIPNFEYSQNKMNFNIYTQISYKNVLETIKTWCETADCGFRTIFRETEKKFIFQIFSGRKTSLIFSKEYENLLSAQYTESVADLSNVALVKGEGTDTDRATVVVGKGIGIERFEHYAPTKDLQSANSKDEDAPPLSYDDYLELLKFRGLEKLSERPEVVTFDAEVNTHGNLRYKTDYDLGDNVKVQSKQWGVILDTRITEITETIDASGISLDLVFGNSLLTLTQKYKRGF